MMRQISECQIAGHEIDRPYSQYWSW